MTLATAEAHAFLERLTDLLPAADVRRVRAEVEGLILDRAEAEAATGSDPLEAERRALAHLGTPETLADTLLNAPVTIGIATRRAFTRWLLVLTAGHLLLSILLSVGQAESAAIPGLLAPLPLRPWSATLSAAVGTVLLDTGLLFVLFVLLGPRRVGLRLPSLALSPGWSRADAARALVLVALLLLVAHPLRDSVFSVRHAGGSSPFLAPDLVALLPWIDLVLGLVGLRALAVLVAGGRSVAALLADAAAALAGIGLLVLASTRSEVVRLPPEVLGPDTAHVLNGLITRAFLVIFVGAALLLTVRLIKRLLRLRLAWVR